MTMTAASNIRVVTKPIEAAPLCRLITGYSATAVPMPARAVTRSRKAPEEHLGVGTGAEDVVRIVQHGAEQEDGRDRGEEGDQVEDAPGERELPPSSPSGLVSLW